VPTTRAVIYAAKSSPDERASIPSQIEECAAYAERQGWVVVQPDEPWGVKGGYSDEDASAYRGSRGPGLVAAHDHAARLAAEGQEAETVLLAFSSDRLARGDAVEAVHLAERWIEARKAGYVLSTVAEGKFENLVFSSFYGERNHHDSKIKGEHSRRGLRTMVKDGRYIGSRRPYGYVLDGKREERRLLIEPHEAAVVRRMASWYEGGAGDKAIAGSLNAEGIPSPSGGLWEGSTVRNILRSPIIAGFVHVNGERYEGQHEPIIEPEQLDRLLTIRDARKGKGRRPVGGHVFVGGILRCPECRSALRARTTPRGYAYYECTGRSRKDRPVACDQPNISRETIEGLILGYLLGLVFDPDQTRARIEAAATAERERAGKLIQLAEGRVRAVERKREKVMREYVGVMAPELLTEALATLDSEREQVEARAAELREAADAAQEEAANIDAERAVVERLERLQEVARGERSPETVEAIRDAISATFRRVYLAEGEKPGTLMVVPELRREAVAALGEKTTLTTRDGQYESRTQTPARRPLPEALTRPRGRR
jgi:site-specific DNA recombinase